MNLPLDNQAEDVGRVGCAETGPRPAGQAPTGLDASRFDPARFAEVMQMDITHLLYAIDHGYFGDGRGLADSAFVACLRKYALPGFEPVKQVQPDKTTWSYRDGVRAASNGDPRDSNPCNPVSEDLRSFQWFAGYDETVAKGPAA